eukprot:evm.model.NODE_41412_length_12843_cov_39.674374.5
MEGGRDEAAATGGGGAEGVIGCEEEKGKEDEVDDEQAGWRVEVLGSDVKKADKGADGPEDRCDEEEDDGGGIPAASVMEAKKVDGDDGEKSDEDAPSTEAMELFLPCRCPAAPSAVDGRGRGWTGKGVNRAGKRRRSREYRSWLRGTVDDLSSEINSPLSSAKGM